MQDLSWILDSLPAGIFVGNVPDGSTAFTNPAFERIIGRRTVAGGKVRAAPQNYGLHDRQGNPYPVENLPFSRAMHSGQAVEVDDIVIHRPDGKKVNIRAFGHPAFDSAGKMTHVVVAFFDITREVAAESERRMTEAQLALAVNHAPIVIWSTDKDGIITLSEGAGLASLGVRSGQLVGMNIFELYREHPTIAGYVTRAFAGQSFSYTVQVGEAVYDTWITPLRDEHDAVAGVAALSHDVSEIRRLQSTAIQNDRVIALGTLAASVAHEINNPLTYMLGHTRRLEDGLRELEKLSGALPDAQRASMAAVLERMGSTLKTLASGTERIAGITRDLRTFSRSDSDESTHVDLRLVTRSVLQLVQKEIEARAQLKVDLGETAAVRGNEARLVQVILNLVVNAMQALPEDEPERHQITLRTCNEGRQVVVEVSDTGPGVPYERRERIFEPFVSTKEIGVGTGLGLFVSRNIVRSFGGDIVLVDQPHGGALFRVTLPQYSKSRPPLNSEPGSAKLASGSSAGRVLVIDDESLVAQVLCAHLHSAGYQAHAEQDAKRALQTLSQDPNSYDLVFCDLMMKGMTGMELSEALKVERPEAHMKVVFMTGGAFTPKARAFLEAHAAQCVEKPFDVLVETERRLRKLRR